MQAVDAHSNEIGPLANQGPADPRFISVANYKYDSPLSDESSQSSELVSEGEFDIAGHGPTVTPNAELNGFVKHNGAAAFDSEGSEDKFLECESDAELSNASDNPFFDYSSYVNVYKETRKLEEKALFESAVNPEKAGKHKGRDKGKSSGSSSKRSPRKVKYPRILQNLESDEEAKSGSETPTGQDLAEPAGEFDPKSRGELVDPDMVVETERAERLAGDATAGIPLDGPAGYPNGIERSSSFSDSAYGIGSDVNSDVEARLMDLQETQRSSTGDDHEEPPDEVDQLFERVINTENDPEFTFKPVSLDPHVKLSSAVAKKVKQKQPRGPGRKSSSRSSSSASSRDGAHDAVCNGAEALETCADSDELKGLGAAPEPAPKAEPAPEPLALESRQETFHTILEDEDLSSGPEKEAPKGPAEPEKAAPLHGSKASFADELARDLKHLKVNDKPKKHKGEPKSDEEEKDKKAKKKEEAAAAAAAAELSEPEKPEKPKKGEKAKRLPWKSTDYEIIFAGLGDCFSSGYLGADSTAIVLPKRGFYTIFFRNSRYPYDSNIDFYLFRVGFKYMLVNESRNHNFNIDDVVDYGNFRLKLSGSMTLRPNVTKMALIYTNSERQTLEFALTPSAFDSKPKVAYKMFFSGPLMAVPTPLRPKRRWVPLILRLRVLSLDNSENLGTSVIGALYLLEKKLSEMKKKKVNLGEYFDYICGTGAGALIALCLLKGFSMKDLRAQWHLIVSSLFKWVYSLPSGIIFDYYYTEEFKKNFINVLGADFMSSRPAPHCMVTCTNVRSNPYELFLFRNYGNSKRRCPQLSVGSIEGTAYAPMWLAGWAACALPTYVR